MKKSEKIIIEIKNLCKNYGKARGVTKVDLEVYEGETFGFIGPNGAGKSTTIRTMLNFLFPTSGEIKIFGLDVITNSSVIKSEIGYVPAEVNYYDHMKVIDLLNFAASFHSDVDKIRIDYLCNKFELDKNRKINELSFGNKKKVSIIQALLHHPKLLILDEPTNGLDPLMQKKVFEMLKEEKDMTIFLSSHNLAEVEKHCDRVAIIKEGKIVDIKDVSKVNKGSIKKVVITTYKKIKLKLNGISDMSFANNELQFRYDGDINVLLEELSKYNISDIAILPLTLEDSFIEYYGSRG
ncbi:MAG TPA: ABC transporter ATP-binding protein [Mollicutes bacterium]|nr:ABC transporter ATP-binding protein [Mollicutes bacterium]